MYLEVRSQRLVWSSFFTCATVFVVPCTSYLRAQNFSVPPAQKCTVTNIAGNPIQGTVCGGTSHGLGCTAGVLYRCNTNSRTNNCSIQSTCSNGCLTNGSAGSLNDSCFTGPFAPINVSPLNTVGGADLSVTLNLNNAHPDGAYVNLKIDRGDIVPGAYCAPPFELSSTQASTTFGLSSAVVNATTPVHMFSDLSYTDSAGVSRELASRIQVVTFNPGGTLPPTPPLASFSLSPSTINAGGQSVVTATLSRMAPANGVQVNLSSSNSSVANIVNPGQPFINGSCLTSNGTVGVQAANNVPQTTTVTISASDGATGQNPLTQPLTVNAGCVPITCSGGPSCGQTPDGCGGTINCGCTNLPGQTCGGGGVPNQCGPAVLAVSAVSMNPSTVVAGNSSTGTVTLNGAAPSGGALVTISSSNSFVQVPGSITIAQGQTTGTFTATTTAFMGGSLSAQISAAKGDTVNTTLTVTGQ